MLFLPLIRFNFLLYISHFIKDFIEIVSIFIAHVAADILDRDDKGQDAADRQDEQVGNEELLAGECLFECVCIIGNEGNCHKERAQHSE